MNGLLELKPIVLKALEDDEFSDKEIDAFRKIDSEVQTSSEESTLNLKENMESEKFLSSYHRDLKEYQQYLNESK